MENMTPEEPTEPRDARAGFDPLFDSLPEWIKAWNTHSHPGPPCAYCEQLDAIGYTLGVGDDDDE